MWVPDSMVICFMCEISSCDKHTSQNCRMLNFSCDLTILPSQRSMRRNLLWSSDQSRATSFRDLSQQMSVSCKDWSSYVFGRKKYFVFSLLRGLMGARYQRGKWLHGCVHLTLSHKLAMFNNIDIAKEDMLRYKLTCNYTSHIAEDHVTPCVFSSHHDSPLCHVCWSKTSKKRRY